LEELEFTKKLNDKISKEKDELKEENSSLRQKILRLENKIANIEKVNLTLRDNMNLILQTKLRYIQPSSSQ